VSEPIFPSTTLRTRASSIEAAAVAGIVCAVGWGLSFWGLLRAPGLGATDEEITEFYASSSNRTAALIWVQVLVFSTIAFLWFVGVVRGRIGDREPKLFGTVFFGASILLAGLLFLGAALLAAPAVQAAAEGQGPDPGAVSLLRGAAAVVLSVFVPRIATLVMFSTASLGRVTGALPRWLIIVTFVAGAYELVNVTLKAPTIYVFPVWMALVSVVLLVRHPTQLLLIDPDRPTNDEDHDTP
jgi:hypothetical protein